MAISYEKDIHEALLEVYETGFNRVEVRHLKRWYDADRITNRVWDDLKSRFAEIDDLHEQKGWRLGYLDWDTGPFLVFICLDPDGTKFDDSSFQPIDSLKSDRKKRAE